MNLTDIKKLVAQDESETLEFKKSTSKLKEAAQTICAFANTKGGTVLIGVTPDLQIVGQEITDSTQQKIAAIRQLFEPAIPLDIEFITADNGNKVIAIKVYSAALNPPYSFDGRAYQRVNNTTQRMPAASYNELIIKQSASGQKWEDFIAEDYTVEDLDHEEILKTIDEGIQCGRIPASYRTTNIEEILIKLGLMKSNRVTRAAAVLFAKDLLFSYSQCVIKLAKFTSTDKRDPIDNRRVEAHAFTILKAGIDFVRQHMPITSTLKSNSIVREDNSQFPIIAVREALINAICHRNYDRGAISLFMFNDRLEIWSEGVLPLTLQIADLSKAHASIPRNKKITRIFYLRKLLEEFGSGTLEIIKQCKINGLPEPEFREITGSFVAIIKAKERLDLDKILSDRQKLIVEIIRKHDPISISEIQGYLRDNIARRTLQRELNILQQIQVIESTGNKKLTTWGIKG